jgi:vacuolar-type H+-ATPase subunit I/STV1
MKEKELDEITKIDLDLLDVDELALGLEITSYKTRKTIIEFSDLILELQADKSKLQQEKQELIEWLEKKLETLDDEVPTANQTEYLIIDVLNKIKGWQK